MPTLVENLLTQRGEDEAFRGRVRRLSGGQFQEAISTLLHEMGEKDASAYFDLSKLMSDAARHYETVRATVTTGILAATGAILALVARSGAGSVGAALPIALIVLGLFGVGLAWRLNDAMAFHFNMSLVWRKAFLRTLKEGRPDFLWRVASARFHRTNALTKVLSHEALWIGLNFLPILVGILLWTKTIGPE